MLQDLETVPKAGELTAPLNNETPGKTFEAILLKVARPSQAALKSAKKIINISEIITKEGYLEYLKPKKERKEALNKKNKENKTEKIVTQKEVKTLLVARNSKVSK